MLVEVVGMVVSHEPATDRRFAMTQGDITVDQAHRGYDITVDETGKT